VQNPVGGGALIITPLVGALSKAAKIDDVAHRNYRLSNEQPPYCGYPAKPFGATRDASRTQRYFLPPRNTRFVDRERLF
jgi:hypothetical protein